MNPNIRTIPSAPGGLEITDIRAENAQFPSVCPAPNGNVLVHWQSYNHGHDSLRVAMLVDGKIARVQEISGPGEVLYPVCLPFGDAVWYAWSECENMRWAIKARCLQNGAFGEILTLEEGDGGLFYPCLFTHRAVLHAMWTRQGKGESQAILCPLWPEGPGEREVVSLCKEAYRANACEGGDGNLYVVYESPQNSGYDLLARAKTPEGWTAEARVDQSEAWASGGCVMRGPSGAAVCWYTFDYDARYSVMSADLSVAGGVLLPAAPATVTEGVGWYLDMAAACGKSGLQVLAYTWSKNDVQVRWRRDGGAWSEPACVSYHDGHCAVHPRLWVNDDNTVLLAWQYALKNGHYDRNAQVVLTRFTAEEIDARADKTVETAENDFCVPIVANRTKRFDTHAPEAVRTWLDKNGYTEKTLLFGDIHGQSNISDGMGYIDQYYHRSRARAKLDFVALTDHDCYPDWISQSEWELMRTTNRLMNTDGELSCLLAYEWTPNEYRYDFGHKNIYYKGDVGGIFRSGEDCGMTPPQLYASVKRHGAFCVPHHPAADWGHVSAATDWNFFDAEAQPLVEIFSRHAPYEDFESQSKFTKNIKKFERCSIQDALCRGYRFGFTAGSDSHQMEHGVEGGIVAVFAQRHTRGDIWDALRHRRSYGTTGARILLSMKVNGVPMGGETSHLKTAPLTVEASVLGTAPLRLEVLKNNQVAACWRAEDGAYDAVFTDAARGDSDCYYLRVTQDDEHMAWCSPVWVEGV